ncbi:hypothetical protein AGMMS50249_6000 [candidate division SR1 bacterium]|nr:hypothetical protein AGMMS50249_6000 [candidate division SR1 bacterium]
MEAKAKKSSLDMQEIFKKIKNMALKAVGKAVPEEIVDGDKKPAKKFLLSKQLIMTKKNSVITAVTAGIMLLGTLGFGYYVYTENDTLNKKSPDLAQLSKLGRVNVSQDMQNQFIPYLTEDISSVNTIHELLQVKQSINNKLNDYKKLFVEQTNYYEYFLNNLYLPTLNIWKDPYTQQIDISIIGQKYLDTDPFQDMFLIQYWSDFFRNVGNGNEYNEISEITIGDMSDIDADHFIVPVTLRFRAPDKRSFLLLVNKLSITSSTTNLSLLNEFFYYMVKNIEDMKADEMLIEKQKFQEQFLPNETGENLDDLIPNEKIIGYTIRQRLDSTGDISLINDEVLDATIVNSANCDALTLTCLYNFREKYRNFPSLVYTMGMDQRGSITKTEYFKEFLSELAPIIAVKDFTFQKVKVNKTLDSSVGAYDGSVTFNAYGRSIPSADVDEIAQALGIQCFGTKDEAGNITASPLSIEDAISKIQDNLARIGDNLQSADTVNQFEELNSIFTQMSKDYPRLNNYHKIIKLFELYRMLKDGNICSAH